MPSGEVLRKQIWSRGRQVEDCTHTDQIKEVTPDSQGCGACLASGDSWVHLRLCLTCGHVGCCENSKNKHALKHHRATEHPIVQSMEKDDEWMWCYVDEVMLPLK